VQSVCEVLGVDFLVRGVFEAGLPAMRWRGGRRDEEEFAGGWSL